MIDMSIGNNCKIYHAVTLGQNHAQYLNIGNNVIIYLGIKIIGDNFVIDANTVVTKIFQIILL